MIFDGCDTLLLIFSQIFSISAAHELYMNIYRKCFYILKMHLRVSVFSLNRKKCKSLLFYSCSKNVLGIIFVPIPFCNSCKTSIQLFLQTFFFHFHSNCIEKSCKFNFVMNHKSLKK